MNSKSRQNSYQINITPKLKKDTTLSSLQDNKTAQYFQPKNDIFDEIMKELENAKVLKDSNSKENKENINSKNLPEIPNPVTDNLPSELTDINLPNDFNFSRQKNSKDYSENKDDSQFVRMEKLREGLQNQPHFDFGIPLNENASLSVIQKFKEKKEIKQNFENILRKINILKWLKVYNILMNREIQSVNLCLNTLKKMYSFDSGNTSILCEVKNLFIIDCYQLLDVIDANFNVKKIILTKNVKKDSKDKGKIKILYEYYVNIGDLILFKRPLKKLDIVYGEEFIELDVKDIQKIVTF